MKRYEVLFRNGERVFVDQVQIGQDVFVSLDVKDEEATRKAKEGLAFLDRPAPPA